MLHPQRVLKCTTLLRPFKKNVQLVRFVYGETHVPLTIPNDYSSIIINLKAASIQSRIQALSLLHFVTLDNGQEVVPDSPLAQLLNSGELTSCIALSQSMMGNSHLFDCVMSSEPVVGWIPRSCAHQQVPRELVTYFMKSIADGAATTFPGMGRAKLSFSPRSEYFVSPAQWDFRCVAYASGLLHSHMRLLSMVRLRQEPRDNCIEMKVMLPVLEALVDTNETSPKKLATRQEHLRDAVVYIDSLAGERFDLCQSYALLQLHRCATVSLDSRLENFVAQDRAAQLLYELGEDDLTESSGRYTLPVSFGKIKFRTRSAQDTFDRLVNTQQSSHSIGADQAAKDIDFLLRILCEHTLSIYDFAPVLVELSVLSWENLSHVILDSRFVDILNRLRATFEIFWRNCHLDHYPDVGEEKLSDLTSDCSGISIHDLHQGYSARLSSDKSRNVVPLTPAPFQIGARATSAMPLPDYNLTLFCLSQALRRLFVSLSRDAASYVDEMHLVKLCCTDMTWFAARNVGWLSESALLDPALSRHPQSLLVSRFDNHSSSFTIQQLAFGQRCIPHYYSLREVHASSFCDAFVFLTHIW